MSTKETNPYLPNDCRTVTLDAITADVAEGSAEIIECAGATAIMIQITAADINNRQCDFTVYVSNDGETFEQYNMLFNNEINDETENLTRVATLNQTADGTDVLWFTPETLGAITHLKVVADVTDAGSPAGTFTVKVSVRT